MTRPSMVARPKTILAIDQLMIDRFYAKTRPAPCGGGCIEWTGEIDKDGYGVYSPRRNNVRKRWRAHRFALVIAIGTIPDGHEVDHLCRNRRCVNPDHLEAVTPRENHDRWTQSITHCPQGHEYTSSNTRVDGGGRRCRECDRARQRLRYWRDPEAYREKARRRRAA